jgi:pyridoxamine 5'-phosphate oxidase family protein
MFTVKELAYIKAQRLARIATVAPDGQPDVMPVAFQFDGKHFYVGGHDVEKTRKYKNVLAGGEKVALVLDDWMTVNPWQARGIRIYGTAEAVEYDGFLGNGMYLRITPRVSWSWGVENQKMDGGKSVTHKSVHTVPVKTDEGLP